MLRGPRALTCCRLRDVDLGSLLLWKEGGHTAELGEAAGAVGATGGGCQTPTLKLLGLHLADVRGVRGGGGLGAVGGCCVGARTCWV